MKETVLDITGCEGLLELHGRIRQAFDFPAHYGANLDALWDMRRDYIGSTDGEMERVVIKGADTLPAELQAYFAEKVMGVLRDLAQEKGSIHFEAENKAE